MRTYSKMLKNVLKDLTYSEEKLANYIDEHRSEICDMTSQKLANEVGVGQSTIIRFSQKLGYGNYKKMIADIGIDHPDEFIDLEIDANESTEITNAKIKGQYGEIIDMSFSINTEELIDQAVNYIYGAKKIICFGFSERNNYFAQYFSYKLSRIGLDSFCNVNVSLVYSQLRQCKKDDCLILFSESGETRDLINFAKIAKKRGMKVISITRISKNSLQQVSDVNLKMVEYGSRTFLRDNMVRFSLLVVLDLLFLNLIKRDFDNFEDKATELSIYTKLGYKA